MTCHPVLQVARLYKGRKGKKGGWESAVRDQCMESKIRWGEWVSLGGVGAPTQRFRILKDRGGGVCQRTPWPDELGGMHETGARRVGRELLYRK